MLFILAALALGSFCMVFVINEVRRSRRRRWRAERKKRHVQIAHDWAGARSRHELRSKRLNHAGAASEREAY